MVFVDGDAIAHRLANAHESTWYTLSYDDGTREFFQYKQDMLDYLKTNGDLVCIDEKVKIPSTLKVLRRNVRNYLKTAFDWLNSKDIRIVIGSPGVETFRHRLAVTAPYKGNREDLELPVHLTEVYNILRDFPKTIVAEDEEADDVLGKMITKHKRAVCLSVDKDLLQVPGLHANIVTKTVIKSRDPGDLWIDTSTKTRVLRGYGIKFFLAQLLLGDKVDNIIKPHKGIGPVAVMKLLGQDVDVKSMWLKVVNIYKEANRNIWENANLLFILRDHRYFKEWFKDTFGRKL